MINYNREGIKVLSFSVDEIINIGYNTIERSDNI